LTENAMIKRVRVMLSRIFGYHSFLKPISLNKDLENIWIWHILTPHLQRAYPKPAPHIAPMKLYGERTAKVGRMCGQCAAYP